MARKIIITRHAGTVEWLRRRGLEGRVIEHARPEDIAQQDVVGILPLALAAFCASVTTIDLPGLAPEQRGQELTPEQMDQAGATLRRYRVEEVDLG